MVLLGPLLGDEMPHELCHQFGFDRSAIIERVNLLGLGGPSVPMIAAELQSHVIEPNVDGVARELGCHPGGHAVVAEARRTAQLRELRRRARAVTDEELPTRRRGGEFVDRDRAIGRAGDVRGAVGGNHDPRAIDVLVVRQVGPGPACSVVLP